MQRDSDDFIVISKRARKRIPPVETESDTVPLTNEPNLLLIDEHKFNCAAFLKRIKAQSIRFGNSSFVKSFDSRLTDRLQTFGIKPIREVICYGLGRFGTDRAAQDQLKFLIHLTKTFPSSQCSVYDPVFTANEKQVLGDLRLNLIESNEQCCRPLSPEDSIVIFFLPHCHKFMFNNLLWSNWNRAALNRIILIGNSFERMTTFLDEPNDPKTYSYLHECVRQKLVHEIRISTGFRNLYGFHEMSIHIFPAPDPDQLSSQKTKMQACYSPKQPTYPELN